MKYITYGIILFIFWLLLSLDLSFASIITGIIAAAITVVIFGKFFFNEIKKLYQPKRYFWLFIYVFVFVWECIKANIDVAYRVIHPALPIKPGIVKIPLVLRSTLGRAMLANSITMTPGTISIDIINDYIYVHWIYMHTNDPESYSKYISEKFEKFLIKIFD